MKVLVDTSAVVAIANKADQYHSIAMLVLEKSRLEKVQFLITNFIVAEVYALLLSRKGAYIARKWLKDNDIPVVRIRNQDEERAKEILFKYTDKEFSYVDATSFAIMEKLKIDTAFAFDNHFNQFGFQTLS